MPDDATLVHSFHPRTWFQDTFGDAQFSPDSQILAYTNEGVLFLLNIVSGQQENISERLGYDWVFGFRWAAGILKIEFTGRQEAEFKKGVYDLSQQASAPSISPRGAGMVTWSDKGNVMAYRLFEAGKNGIWIANRDAINPILIVPDVPPVALAISPDETELAYLIRNEEGWMELRLTSITVQSTKTLVKNLDTSNWPHIAYSPDGKQIYLSLVGEKPGTLADKHVPDTDRDLDVYSIDSETGEMRLVATQPGDDLVLGVTGQKLVWITTKSSMHTGILPFDGGDIRPLLGEQTSLPYWRPDGKQVSVMYGQWRLADWALNWDLGTVNVDTEGKVVGSLKPEISGYHEDFALVWSPDGRWMAYHSHRSPTPVASYSGEGSTDDIWLRASEGGSEIRLTDFGNEVGMPNWAADSRRILFCTLEKDGTPSRPWIITIDPLTGKPESVVPLQIKGIEGDVVSTAWSPTRDEIALEEALGRNLRRLWLISEDGTATKEIATYEALAFAGGVDFSPDGNHIIYAALANDHHQLFRIGRDGSQTKQLTHSTEEILFPQVAPDGRLIACTIYSHTKEIWTANIPNE